MSLSRINGDEKICVSGVFALRRAETLDDHGITHILSVIDYSLDKADHLRGRFEHLSIDIDDDEDADLLVHFPRMVRFIEAAVDPGSSRLQDTPPGTSSRATPQDSRDDGDAITPAPPSRTAVTATPRTTATPGRQDSSGGGILVHCAMGKSRSVSAVVAYLLWKHAARFGAAGRRNPDRDAAARAAVAEAVGWVRATREMAEPNNGFMRQLAMWWDMGTPATADDAVERHPTYRRWLYRREVEESARVGRAPDWIRFEDEVQPDEDAQLLLQQHGREGAAGAQEQTKRHEVRCKKCRRVLATGRFVVPHVQRQPTDYAAQVACPHVFIEPLSWMRPVLETGGLEGRLVCPGPRCGASIGRYAWQGFKCSCDEWVCPAFSLQKSKVDEVAVPTAGGPASADKGPSDRVADPRAALGIRMPPSLRKENL